MAELKRKRFQVVFEVEVIARELDDEVVRETQEGYSDPEGEFSSSQYAAHVERQRRLLAALADHPRVLDGYIRNEVLLRFEDSAAYDALVRSEGAPQDDYDLASRVLDDLSDIDKRIFIQSQRDGVFAEDTEKLSGCFESRIVSARVDEIS